MIAHTDLADLQPEPALQTIQLGKEWISEMSGGLNRYYSGLVQALPSVGVGVRGLVVGSEHVTTRTAGMVEAFAPPQSSLRARLAGVRHGARRAWSAAPDGLFVPHFALYAAPCLDLRKGRPMVVHFHGPWSDESRVEGSGRLATSVKHWTERRVYERATRLIVLSRAFARLLEERYRIAPERIRVIPGGVDTARFAPAHTPAQARHALGWPADRPIAFVVRRLVKRMGLEALLAAVSRAQADVPELLVLIAGSGPLAHDLRQLTSECGLDNHVRFLGFMPDDQLPLAYRAADFTIVPSVALEGFGLIVVESLAAGTPALVTAVGGLPETIEELAPQCIVRDAGASALAAAIVDAVQGRVPMPGADACMRHARTRFDWTAVTRRVRDTYVEALQ